uniref:CYP3025A2-6 n=1 Tax=Eurytemora affinis TaxID=88015 RepID=A0A8B0MC14_EURAF|nr:CYP3025A2-6 [Eurytemora affinis]
MLFEIGLLVLTILLYIYYEVTKQYGFFKDLGVPFLKPSFPFGSENGKKMFLGKISLQATDVEAVKEFPKEKVFGYFLLGQPIFVINNEELAKKVLIKDFEYFTDRRTFDTADPIANAFLTNLTGMEWKQMRSMLSGVFTSGKLKLMAKHVDKVGKNFEKYVASKAKTGEEIDMKVVGGLMTLDSIASAGFGIEVDSFKEPENTFRIMALTLVGAPGYRSSLDNIKMFFIATLPKVGKFLKISFMKPQAVNFFSDILRKTYKRRMATGEKRNDIIDVIVEELRSTKTKKPQTFESDFEKDAALDTSGLKDIRETGLDEEILLISNALLFFLLDLKLHLLEFQLFVTSLLFTRSCKTRYFKRFLKFLGKVKMPALNNFRKKYLDMFISECFRVTSLVGALERKCVKDYLIPNTDVIIPKGRFVKLYTNDISVREDNFKNPNDFDPENFAPENNPNKFAMMIFGQGPRNCIGMRYALLTIKITMVYLLRNHRVVRSGKTTDVLEVDPANFNVFKNGVFMKIEKR